MPTQKAAAPPLDRLLQDIQAAIGSGDRARQSLLVLRSAEALTGRWSRLPPESKAGFDLLLVELLGQVDEAARHAFARRLAPLRRAPRRATTLLAQDPSIHVAGPILETGRSFDEPWLLALVAACGDLHRAAIARRARFGPALSEALIAQGGPPVAVAVLANPAAPIPEAGLPWLLHHAGACEEVAVRLGARPDLPDPLRTALLDLARGRAEAALSEDIDIGTAQAGTLAAAVADILARPVAPARAARFSASMAAGDPGAGGVTGDRLERWLDLRRIEDVLAALARDAGLPVEAVVAAYDAEAVTALAALVRGLGHPWPTLKALLRTRHGDALDPDRLREAHRLMSALSPRSARRLIRYGMVRQGGSAFLAHLPD